ncbi:hypothetical protein KVP09_09875 [Alcaligenaceae bacterium CGII-47]|nr:hypothetical protein [Alcaligenaceae bacterium CGII-47]
MSLPELLNQYWDVIAKNPVFFITTAFVFSGIGFYFAKLVYGAIANIARERLEAARDDAARLERAKREESETVSKLREELEKRSQGGSHSRQVPIEQRKSAAEKPNSIGLKVADGGSAKASVVDSFFLSIPHRSLEDALDEARKVHKLVFAVIYDESHPRQSKLTYSLGYFMEYHTTKKLVDEYFIPAVVKASNEKAAELVPSDDPLENCLWVVMTSAGEVLRREGVYANPDEGLKRVRAVIASAGKI